MLDGAAALLFLVAADTQQIVQVNSTTADVLGWPVADLVGRPITDVEDSLADFFYWDAVASGDFVPVTAAPSSYCCSDGRHIRVRKSAKKVVAAGKPYVVVSATDSRRSDEQADELAQAVSRLSAIFEATTEGILVTEVSGAVTAVNRRLTEMWELPERCPSPTAIAKQMAAATGDARRYAWGMRKLAKISDSESFDVIHLKTGRVVERKSRPQKINGVIVGRVFTFSDVTERTQALLAMAKAKDEALLANNAKSQFLSTMSHEIRTPMNGVIGMADLLLTTELAGEQQEYAQIVRASAHALLAVINGILDLSKIESGKLQIERIPFGLRDLLAEVVDICSLPAYDKGLDFILRISPELPDNVVGDPAKIRQILINLCGNAVKFTERGYVQLAAEVQGSSVEDGGGLALVRFTVSDTGIGIAKAELQTVFQAFSQADGSVSRKYGGTGLGLTISKRLAENLGGRLSATSAVGLGSVFELVLPLSLDACSAYSSHHVSLLHTRPVLVLGGHPAMQDALAEQMIAWGGTVVKATTSPDAKMALSKMAGIYPRAGLPIVLHWRSFDNTGLDLENCEVIGLVPLGTLKTQPGDLFAPVKPQELFVRLTRAAVPTIQPDSVAMLPAGVHILLVEDNAVNQRVAQALVTKMGCASVTIAENGAVAITTLERMYGVGAPPDLILMDCFMPVMDGFAATQAIRESEAKLDRAPLPIIALTAATQEAEVLACSQAGMTDYVAKPITAKALSATLLRWLPPHPISARSPSL